MEVKGHGSKDPVASNDNEADMAKNRRVEIHVEGL
jgi:outer membrane protein OmpA-like peptidoglycan-associated protein